MKVMIEFEIGSAMGMNGLIEEFEAHRDSHIKDTGCENPDQCGMMGNLCWLTHQLKNIKAQMERDDDEKVWKYEDDDDDS